MQRLTRHFRLMFGVFVLVGATVIVLFTNFGHLLESGPTKGPAYFGMVVSVVGLMCVFGIAVWVRSRSGQATEMDAESFYYLGFIYTLVTLIATFYPMLS